MSTTKETASAEEIEKILNRIDNDIFDCADALQNAYSTIKYRRQNRQFDSEAIEKAEEYLREWPPVWMRDDTFTPNQTAEKIGTDKLRDYIRSLEAKNKELQEEVLRLSAIALRAKELESKVAILEGENYELEKRNFDLQRLFGIALKRMGGKLTLSHSDIYTMDGETIERTEINNLETSFVLSSLSH